MEPKVEKVKELDNGVILLSAKGMFPKESIEEQEKFLSEKTGKKVVIIDSRYEFILTL